MQPLSLVNASRLLIVTVFWPTELNRISGIFVVQQVAALTRAGFHVTVVVPKVIGRARGKLCSPADLGLDEHKVALHRAPTLRLPEVVAGVPGAIQVNSVLGGVMLRHRLRGIIADNPHAACIVHGLRYAGLSLPAWRDLLSKDVVHVIHGVDPFFTDPRNRRRTRPLVEKSANATDAIVLVGNPLRAHAEAIGMPASKLHVVANGTDLPARDTITSGQRSITERRRIVSVSNLIPLKGIELNLQALSRVASRRPDLDWEYRIVGDGVHRPSLEVIVAELQLGERIRFTGRLAYAETMREIADADIFSLPSWGEAFGIVYLEAMARMRPPVGCLHNGAADIITNGVDGLLVPPRDITALAEALELLLCSPERCREIGSAARETAERYSWDHNAKQMIRILRMECASAGDDGSTLPGQSLVPVASLRDSSC